MRIPRNLHDEWTVLANEVFDDHLIDNGHAPADEYDTAHREMFVEGFVRGMRQVAAMQHDGEHPRLSKVEEMPMFHTPVNQDQLLEWISRHPPADRPSLYTCMGMTWNYLASVINPYLLVQPVETVSVKSKYFAGPQRITTTTTTEGN